MWRISAISTAPGTSNISFVSVPSRTSYPWLYAVVLLVVSKFVNSQAAAVAIILPVAIQVGVPTGIVVSMISACYGYYILPTYPSALAALQFDRSGTTYIGKFVINHSFIIPGLIGVITATVVGAILGYFYEGRVRRRPLRCGAQLYHRTEAH